MVGKAEHDNFPKHFSVNPFSLNLGKHQPFFIAQKLTAEDGDGVVPLQDHDPGRPMLKHFVPNALTQPTPFLKNWDTVPCNPGVATSDYCFIVDDKSVFAMFSGYALLSPFR